MSQRMTLTRRQLLRAAGAAGLMSLAGGLPGASAQTACPPATNGAGFYRFRVGHFTVMVLADGTAPVPAYHFPFPATGRIRRVDDHFEFVPVVWTW